MRLAGAARRAAERTQLGMSERSTSRERTQSLAFGAIRPAFLVIPPLALVHRADELPRLARREADREVMRRVEAALRHRSDRRLPAIGAEDGLHEPSVRAVRVRDGERLKWSRGRRERGIGDDDEPLARHVRLGGDVGCESGAERRVARPEDRQRRRDALGDVEQLLAWRSACCQSRRARRTRQRHRLRASAWTSRRARTWPVDLSIATLTAMAAAM